MSRKGFSCNIDEIVLASIRQFIHLKDKKKRPKQTKPKLPTATKSTKPLQCVQLVVHNKFLQKE